MNLVKVCIIAQLVLLLILNKSFSQQKYNSLAGGAKAIGINGTKQNSANADMDTGELTITGDADIDFKKLSELHMNILTYRLIGGPKQHSLEELRLYNEKLYFKYRMYGMKLWLHYPNDERRYDWFKKTVLFDGPVSMHYWKDIDAGNRALYARGSYSNSYTADIDWAALTAWEKAYAEMKQAYMDHFYQPDQNNRRKSRIYDPRDIFSFQLLELESFLKRSLNLTYRRKDGKDKIDLDKLERLIVELANVDSLNLYPNEGLSSVSALSYVTQRVLDNDFLSRYLGYGLSDDDVLGLVNRFIHAEGSSGLRKWGVQRRTLLNLRNTPLDLAGTALDGRMVDLKQMKGKVVLVDFWTTWCSSCIARMPAIASMYQKYKRDGFEVISVSLNDDDKLTEVKKIEERVGAGWPTLLIGYTNRESLGYKIVQKYGFYGVPQILLLDKEGKLVMLNDVLRDGDFEQLLLTLLKY